MLPRVTTKYRGVVLPEGADVAAGPAVAELVVSRPVVEGDERLRLAVWHEGNSLIPPDTSCGLLLPEPPLDGQIISEDRWRPHRVVGTPRFEPYSQLHLPLARLTKRVGEAGILYTIARRIYESAANNDPALQVTSNIRQIGLSHDIPHQNRVPVRCSSIMAVPALNGEGSELILIPDGEAAGRIQEEHAAVMALVKHIYDLKGKQMPAMPDFSAGIAVGHLAPDVTEQQATGLCQSVSKRLPVDLYLGEVGLRIVQQHFADR